MASRFNEWRRRQDWWVWAIFTAAGLCELAILLTCMK